MVAQSMARRSKRQQQVEPDDVVLARAIEYTEWARQNIRLVAGVAIALAVLLTGFFWYRADQARRLDRAAIDYLQVEQAALSGNDAIAARDLDQYIRQHEGTPYADEARLLLAQVHLRGERVDEAIAAARPVADRLESSPVGAQAALLVAAAQQQAGDFDGAVATYLQVGERAEEGFRRQEGLMGAALLRSQTDDHAGAAELYRRLVSLNEEGSSERAMFEMRLAEEEALATLQ